MIYNEKNDGDIYWNTLKDIYLVNCKSGDINIQTNRISKSLISFFYNLFPHPYFDLGLKSFENRYITSEYEVEQNECDEHQSEEHSRVELMGMAELYKYIKDYPVEAITSDNFSIFELQELHRRLYSHSPHPEEAGKFRSHSIYLPGSGISISQPERIIYDFFDLGDDFTQIMDLPLNTNDDLIDYIQSSVILTTKLLKVHPFLDGNGRSIRALLNLMFKKANVPPVYILPEEKLAYQSALTKAQTDEEYGGGNYDDIISFYFHKICNSLIEITDSPNSMGEDFSGDVKEYKKGDFKKYNIFR